MRGTLRLIGAVIVALFTVVTVAATSASHPGDHLTDQRTISLLADAPSLQLHIMLMGKGMHIHGESIFDMFAKPVVADDGVSVRYDGFATFIQGESQFTYMLVDGAAYAVESTGNDTTSVATQTVRCLESLTPFDLIVSALNTVRAVPRSLVDDEVNFCPTDSGTFFQTSTPFGGVNFTLCASTTSGFIAYGGDITMIVEYLDDPLRSFTAPKLSDSSAHCAIVATATAVTPIAAALLTGKTDSLR
ncbi:hypothetical protein PR003_g12727 [Phytophthora rubi]|uniref:Uncharacterized protein n=1 Tax=Phytophthora rubi TaxID=129364 RepID=A0A6A4EZD9_9STRA|nr:hypothetical protein PR002_g14953 [Phytophthora rubi]KAE9017304.1 hypothetical protein PR001_g14435 [Phytophthora rubi]KAE9336012.1 hypothetical protein PR003_g12727 [Phytophthora rubi]